MSFMVDPISIILQVQTLDGKSYEPHVTSYDYDAPINEQGTATPKYMALRELIGSYLPKGKKLPDIPDPIPAIDVSLASTVKFSSIWDNLPQPVISVKPKPFEAFGQDYGFILYRTELVNQKTGKLISIRYSRLCNCISEW